MKVGIALERQRARGLALCEALGLDPATVLEFGWDERRPSKVQVVIFDGADTRPDRHTEEFDLPEGWQP